MGKVIVLGASYAALAVAKALGQEGIPVVVFATDRHDHAFHSRFISERIISPDPMDDSDGLLALLMDTDSRWDDALLIPTLDEYVIFVSQNRTCLKTKFVFTVQDWEVVANILNKSLLYSEARRLGIPTPHFFLPDSIDSLNERRNKFGFPCILKPCETHKFDRIYGQKVLVVRDFQELMEGYVGAQRNGLAVIVSEIIPGDDASIFTYRSYVDSQGHILAELCTQKLRQYPPGFGQGSVARTIPMIAEIRDQATRLLRAVSYHGQASAEFKFDYRDNRYKLTEVNIRPGVAEWLLVKAGMNFPLMTYLDLARNTRATTPTYREGLYWIHNYWEVVNILRCLAAGKLNLEFIRPYGQKKVFAVPFSDDPINFLFSAYHNGTRALKKARGRGLW